MFEYVCVTQIGNSYFGSLFLIPLQLCFTLPWYLRRHLKLIPWDVSLEVCCGVFFFEGFKCQWPKILLLIFDDLIIDRETYNLRNLDLIELPHQSRIDKKHQSTAWSQKSHIRRCRWQKASSSLKQRCWFRNKTLKSCQINNFPSLFSTEDSYANL